MKKAPHNSTKELYESPRKEQNIDKYGDDSSSCICCGRPMAAGPCLWVRMNEAWEAVRADIHEDDFKTKTGTESQGGFPIGSECAKRMTGYTIKGELERSHPYLINNPA